MPNLDFAEDFLLYRQNIRKLSCLSTKKFVDLKKFAKMPIIGWKTHKKRPLR